MTARYRSTGKEVNEPTPREERLYTHPRVARDSALEKISERIEEERENGQLSAHGEAVKNFDHRNADLLRYPSLLNEVAVERQRRLEEAATKRQLPQDWNRFYDDIADDVRKRAGLKPIAELEREEVLDEMKSSRGQKA